MTHINRKARTRVVRKKVVRVRKPKVFTYEKTYLTYPKREVLKTGDKVYATKPQLVSPPLPGGFYTVPASGPTKKLPRGAKLVEVVE